jgi:hypothetical protein
MSPHSPARRWPPYSRFHPSRSLDAKLGMKLSSAHRGLRWLVERGRFPASSVGTSLSTRQDRLSVKVRRRSTYGRRTQAHAGRAGRAQR